MTRDRATRPTLSTNSETKVRAFNVTTNHFLPSWLQQQPSWEQYRCQISLFTIHPGMGGENLSLYAPYHALFRHWSPSRKNTTRTVPYDPEDSALSVHRRSTLTHPRPTAGQPGRKINVSQDSESFHHLILYVTMVSRDGRPFSGHVATAASTAIDKSSPQRHPRHPCLLLPYKRAGRDSTRGQQTTNDEKPVSIPPWKINISSNLLCTLRLGIVSLSRSL
jgi:hypothetical protein